MLYLKGASRVTVIIGLAAACAAQAQDGALSPKELQSIWVGKQISGVIAAGPLTGGRVSFRFNADGTSIISGAVSDTGAWRFNETGYCNAWKKVRKGAEACFKVARKGDELQILNDNGSLNTTVTQVE